MCAGALRRYLESANALPDRPLVSLVPVSLALRGKQSGREGGNAVGTVLCSLATDIADPRKRLAAIRASMVTAKDAMASMTPTQFQITGTLLMAAPLTLAAVPGAGGAAAVQPDHLERSRTPQPSVLERRAHGMRLSRLHSV